MAHLSLKKKNVLIPRGKRQANKFSSLVEEFDGVPIEVPLLDFRPVKKYDELAKKLKKLHTYDWVIFTSQIAVETFFSFGPFDNKTFPKIAAIGTKTAEWLKEKGFETHFIPKHFVTEEFIKEFAPLVNRGDQILLPKGNLARGLIGQTLRDKGAVVDEVVIYETFFPEESKEKLLQLLQEKQLDILPFTSPSSIEHFMSVVNEYNLHEHIRHTIVAAIGPISKKKCEEVGLEVHVMPEVYTTKDMLIAIMNYINNEK